MLIAEEVLLIALSPTTNRPALDRNLLDPALGGALLSELSLAERIGTDQPKESWFRPGRVTVISDKPTDDPELDRALAILVTREGKKIRDQIDGFSGRGLLKGLRERLLGRLVTRGVLSAESEKVLGLVPRPSWPVRDAEAVEEIRRRLQSALVGGAEPVERTRALIAVLAATGKLPQLVDADDRGALKQRAEALSEGDWAAAVVRQVIDQAAATVASTAT